MNRPAVQDPITTQDATNGKTENSRTITTHPAFAQIAATRISGNAHLYDSDFAHQHYISITILRSELMRDLSRDWHFGREELIEIAMSEAQWATFISTPNSGFGVPCTLQHIDRKQVPQLPPPIKRSHQFKGEVFKTMQESLEKIKNLDALIKASGLSAKKQGELLSCARMASMGITNSLGFVADQFDEHMEGTVQRAKVEVNAYATAAIHRAGLDAIAGNLPILTFQDGDKT